MLRQFFRFARARYRALALPIYEELNDWTGQGNVLLNLGVDAYYEGRWHEAIDYPQRARAAYERTNDLVREMAARHNLGEIHRDQGYYDIAHDELSGAVRVWESHQYPAVVLAKANLGLLAARTGEFEQADALMAEARGIAISCV